MKHKSRILLLAVLAIGVLACVALFAIGLRHAEPSAAHGSEPTDEPQAAPQDEAPASDNATVSSTAETPSQPVEAPPPDPLQQLLQSMTPEEKLCQLLIVRPETLLQADTASGTDPAQVLPQWPVGGVIYFADHLVTQEQTTQMIAQMQAASAKIPLFISVDEEGGSVTRVAARLGTTDFEDMAHYGAQDDPEVAYEIGATLARELKPLGFNLNFAPVADVWTNEANTVVRYRSFGSDPELVAQMVGYEVAAFIDGGIICCPKHFPGHGSTGGDTHDGFAATDRSSAELEACDLLPFRACIQAGAPMIMAGHMTLTAIDPDAPASLSSTILTGLLRQKLGYEGLIITDSLMMQAITDNYSTGDAAVQAIAAGCDLLLDVDNIPQTIDALAAAVEDGTLTQARIDESVMRILRCKQAYGLLPEQLE